MAVAAEGPTPVLAGKGDYDNFRRYDAFLAWRRRHTHLGARGDAPYVLFICEDDEQRDDFLARADGELTGHLWHPSGTVDQHEYVGRGGILFCDERDAHLGRSHARRVAPYPPGHPARLGHYAQLRGVKLPGSPSETELGESRRSSEAALVGGSLDGQSTGEAA